uniref:Uncharacterized protein US312 n=1 Tax=Infectious laryngotracheitis virus TaxID=10386 RepID=Q9YPH7_ILTV|nr:unknown [Gallid alphaherpesvirus 1]
MDEHEAHKTIIHFFSMYCCSKIVPMVAELYCALHCGDGNKQANARNGRFRESRIFIFSVTTPHQKASRFFQLLHKTYVTLSLGSCSAGFWKSLVLPLAFYHVL